MRKRARGTPASSTARNQAHPRDPHVRTFSRSLIISGRHTCILHKPVDPERRGKRTINSAGFEVFFPVRQRPAAPQAGHSKSCVAFEKAERGEPNAHISANENMGVKLARSRTPLALAKISGAIAHDPQRYRNRAEPDDKRPIGEPYEWLTPAAQAAWRELVPNLPWLRYSHRGIVGLTATLSAKMQAGDLGLPGLNLLRQCLGKLGATPADAHRVSIEQPSDEDVPGAEYFR